MLISEAPKTCGNTTPTGSAPSSPEMSLNNNTSGQSMAADTLKGLQTHFSRLSHANTKLRGKAALELKEWKEAGIQRLKDLKHRVKEEVKQMEITEKSERDERRHRNLGHHKSKQVVGGWVLTRHQMRFIQETPYLYNASAGSYLEMFCLQRFWLWLAQFIPSFVAPSIITCLGLAINMLCCLNLFYFGRDLRSEAPGWSFLLAAVGLFVYQTLDALDGKQCFKVQNSQIEEVYDHGCDAVSTIFVTLSIAIAAQMGFYPELCFLFFVASMIAFYSTHWVAHVTHTMVFGKIDVSEAQWSMICAHVVTGIWGQKVWHLVLFRVFGFNMTVVHFLVVVTLLTLSRCIGDNVKMALFGKKTPLEEAGIDIPRSGSSAAYGPLYPLGLLTFLAVTCYLLGLFSVSPTVFILSFGFSFAKLTVKLVMMNVSRGEMGKLDSSIVIPFLLALNSVLPPSLALHPYTALLCALVYSIMDFTRYFTYSSWDLRVATDANIFSIKYPVGHPLNRAGDHGFYINGLNNDKILAKWVAFKEEKGSHLLVKCFRNE